MSNIFAYIGRVAWLAVWSSERLALRSDDDVNVSVEIYEERDGEKVLTDERKHGVCHL